MKGLSNLPIELFNHIMSFRPTHPIAKMIKEPCVKTCLEMCDYWNDLSMICFETRDLMTGNHLTSNDHHPEIVAELFENNMYIIETRIYNIYDDDDFDISLIQEDANYATKCWIKINLLLNYAEQMYNLWEARYNTFSYKERGQVWGKSHKTRKVEHRITPAKV
jgi:hypothetical protein